MSAAEFGGARTARAQGVAGGEPVTTVVAAARPGDAVTQSNENYKKLLDALTDEHLASSR